MVFITGSCITFQTLPGRWLFPQTVLIPGYLTVLLRKSNSRYLLIMEIVSLSTFLQFEGKVPPLPQAALSVYSEGVWLDIDIVLQPGLVPQQVLVSGLGLLQLVVEQPNAVLQLPDLGHQPVVRGVPAGLNLGPGCPQWQPGLGDLQWRSLVILLSVEVPGNIIVSGGPW